MTYLSLLETRAAVIPVLTIERLADAVPLARALVKGGLRILEVTLRTSAGADAAAAIRNEVPDAIVALGTVLTDADLMLARSLDVPFSFSPGATPGLLQAARDRGVSLIPGVQTASELMLAAEFGFRMVKFFPAVPAGGIAALKALCGPFPGARFCPTGGIDEHSAPAWLALPQVFAVGGSWLAPAQDIAQGNWEAIETRAARAKTLGRS